MARKFLYLVLAGILLVTAGLFTLRFWGGALSEIAFVPSARFAAPGKAVDYAAPASWISRRTTEWLPDGLAAERLDARVFYVHPTSLFDRTRWNGSLPDSAVDAVTDAFVRAQASAFNGGEVWAPRYRQATFGAMLTGKPEGRQALDAAYADVRAAFAAFMAADDRQKTGSTRPIVLVGHSQGALLLMRLMRDEVAGKPLAARVAAAYVVGWPVSTAHDLPAMGLPACAGPDQPGCVLAWMSYAEPADPAATLEVYDRDPGLDGQSRKGSAILCVNPLTGAPGTAAPAAANLGTMGPGGMLVKGMVPARCGPQGFLLIGPGPQMGAEVMPGNNYHVYDIPLFWANVRADVARRVAAWHRVRP
ncbi:MAG: DUF3089 domain-containing protein [Sphingomonadales bacterium]|nr:DUF3089 domain-containing protein [Sphingomonadales bacterium]